MRYQGEPVAAVVAESPSIADDAAELVQVEYEALDPVVDAEQALHGSAASFTKKLARTASGMAYSNMAMWSRRFAMPPTSSNIDQLHFHRFSSTPLENNVVIAQWDPKDERIYYWCNNSFPFVCHSISCRRT